MKTFQSALILTLLGCVAACAAEPTETPNKAALQPATARTEIDRAAQSLDLGRGEKPADTRAKLEALLAGELSGDERDDALQLVSRAAELSGDRERAISALEQLLARHEGQLSDRLERAPKRLEMLLAGHELKTLHSDDEGRVAPVAYALAKYFPVEKGKTVEVQIVHINPVNNGADEFGTFNIGGAIRKESEKKCPTCSNVSVHTSSHGSNRWSSIPAQQKNMKNALTVIGMDLGEFKLPERYAEYAALPLAEVEARLASGQGLIAVKERPGAPPLVLLAAPRAGQLSLVLETFQRLETLPKEPLSVPLPKGISSTEVRSTMREAKRSFAACYEELLKRNATASGKIVFDLTVDGNGVVSAASMRDGTTLKDATFLDCELAAARALPFPKVGGETTIRYPLTFAP